MGVLAVVVLAVVTAGNANTAAQAAAKGKYRALFNFGDSLADAGNLIANSASDRLATARLPYRQTYFGKPTGRCSDGCLVINHLAQEFGLSLLPPSKVNHRKFKHRANFAVQGQWPVPSSGVAARSIVMCARAATVVSVLTVKQLCC